MKICGLNFNCFSVSSSDSEVDDTCQPAIDLEILRKSIPEDCGVYERRDLLKEKQESLNRLINSISCDDTLDLRRSDLSGVGLTDTDLSKANLSEANLSGAVLREADLIGANFERAKLENVDISNILLPTWNANSLDIWLNHINNNYSLIKTIDSIDAIYRDKKSHWYTN